MENKVNVSVISGSHNQGINDFRVIGCYLPDSDVPFSDNPTVRLCIYCSASDCPDFYPCRLDFPDVMFKPLYDALQFGVSSLDDDLPF